MCFSYTDLLFNGLSVVQELIEILCKLCQDFQYKYRETGLSRLLGYIYSSTVVKHISRKTDSCNWFSAFTNKKEGRQESGLTSIFLKQGLRDCMSWGGNLWFGLGLKSCLS